MRNPNDPKTEAQTEIKLTPQERRIGSTLWSPLAGIGITASGQIDLTLLTAFDMYEENPKYPNRGLSLPFAVMVRKLLFDIYSRETGMLKKFQEELKGQTHIFSGERTDNPIKEHRRKTAEKYQALEAFLNRPGIQKIRNQYNDKFWFQIINPLKAVELIVSLIRLMAHYSLTRLGYLILQQYKIEMDQSSVSSIVSSVVRKGLALIGLLLVGILRLGSQLSLGAVAFVVRAIVSPVKSFHDCNAAHPLAGLLSAAISAGAIGTLAFFTAPIWMPVVAGALAAVSASLALGVGLSLSVGAAVSIVTAVAFMGICASGLISDAFIAAKHCWGKLPVDSHPAYRIARYNAPHKSTTEKVKIGCDMVLIMGAFPLLVTAASLGMIIGGIEKLLRGFCGTKARQEELSKNPSAMFHQPQPQAYNDAQRLTNSSSKVPTATPT